MNETNERGFEEGTVYEHVVGLLSSHALHEGVLLDLGCGFGPIASSCAKLGLDYVGVDIERDGLADLAKQGFSTAQLDLSQTTVLVEFLESVLAGRQLAAITLLDVLEHLAHPGDLLTALADMAGRHAGAPLVVSVSNVSHFDLAAKLLCGRWDVTPAGLLNETDLSLFAPGTLEAEFRRTGWREIKADDFAIARSDQHFPETLTALSAGTPLHDFLLGVRTQSAPGALVSQFVRAYLPTAPPELRLVGPPSSRARVALAASEAASAPFLSVIVRTQGRRLITLEDNLTSLAAQTNRDLEVIVCCHDTSDADYAAVLEVIRRVPTWLAEKTRSIRVEGGLRARPLAAGVAAASGRYVAFLDDDDLALCHWVEEFARQVDLHPGAVVRAGCATHSIDEEPWDCGVGYRQTGPTQTPYPLAFDLLDHLVQNSTPNCSVAVPRSCFTDLGVSFDDELPVLEDWDVLLRASLLCGLASTPEVTSLYRRWRRGYASHVLHSEAQWESAKQAVRGRLDARPFLVPPGTVSRVVELQSKLVSLTDALSSSMAQLDPLQLDREQLSTRLEETEQLLVAAEQRIGEITAAAEERLAEATAVADARLAEAIADADRRLAEAERRLAEAEQRGAEITADADRRVAEITADADRRVAEITAEADRRVAELTTDANRRVAEITNEAEQRGAEATAAADQRVAEITTVAEHLVAEITTVADRRVAEITADAEQRVAEITTVAEQRVAEVTAIADARLFQRRASDAQLKAAVADRDAALARLDEVTSEVTAQVTKQVTARVTAQVTARVTEQVRAEVTTHVAQQTAADVRAEFVASRSWRVTAPLRAVTGLVAKMRRHSG
jgi:hypothetical protein